MSQSTMKNLITHHFKENKMALSMLHHSFLKEDASKDWIFTVGNIKGNHTLLEKMIDKIEDTGLAKNDKVVFLGDFIGQCGDNRAVISMLREYKKLRPLQVNIILGDDEQRLIQARGSFFTTPVGRQVTWSYRQSCMPLISTRYGSLDVMALKEDRHWLNSLPYYLKTKKYFFVHAGVNPNTPTLERQNVGSFPFIDEPFYASDVVYDKTIVYSSLDMKPFIKANRISVGRGNNELSCLILNDKLSVTSGGIVTSGKGAEGLLKVAMD